MNQPFRTPEKLIRNGWTRSAKDETIPTEAKFERGNWTCRVLGVEHGECYLPQESRITEGFASTPMTPDELQIATDRQIEKDRQMSHFCRLSIAFI
jgi:hypothetical protein